MRKTIFPGRSYLWVLAAAALAGGGLVRPEGPLAQGFPPEVDHLNLERGLMAGAGLLLTGLGLNLGLAQLWYEHSLGPLDVSTTSALVPEF